MDTAIFLGQFWGWMLVGLSLVFLVRGKKLVGMVMQSVEDRGFSLSSGFIAFIVGLASVLLVNTWTADWQGAVTILGWISVLKGIMRIGFPEVSHQMVGWFRGKNGMLQLLMVVMLVIGIWLVVASASTPSVSIDYY